MAEKTIKSRQRQKYDTSANWSTNNPVLLAGELGFESDTNKFKVGDGTSHWSDLPYSGGSGGGTTVTINGQPQETLNADDYLNKNTDSYLKYASLSTLGISGTSVDGNYNCMYFHNDNTSPSIQNYYIGFLKDDFNGDSSLSGHLLFSLKDVVRTTQTINSIPLSGDITLTSDDVGAVKKSGDTMTGDLIVGSSSIGANGYIEGTWLRTTGNIAAKNTQAKIAVIDSSGWVYTRTNAQILSDINAVDKSGDTMTGDLGVNNIKFANGLSDDNGSQYVLVIKDNASRNGCATTQLFDGSHKILSDLLISESGTSYVRFSNGIQIVWGTVTGSNNAITYPKPFASTDYGISCCGGTQNTATYETNATSRTTTGCILRWGSGGTQANIHYIAVGKWK